jgi:hypothetical protein
VRSCFDTTRGDSVTKEVDGRGPKHTLLCNDDQPMLEKHLPEMKMLLNVFFAGPLQIVLIGKTTLQFVLNPVNLSVEGIASIPETKGPVFTLKKSKWSKDGSLSDVIRVNRNLMVALQRSILEKMVQPAVTWVKSSMLGRGWESGSVMRLSHLKSWQGHQLPFRLLHHVKR